MKIVRGWVRLNGCEQRVNFQFPIDRDATEDEIARAVSKTIASMFDYRFHVEEWEGI